MSDHSQVSSAGSSADEIHALLTLPLVQRISVTDSQPRSPTSMSDGDDAGKKRWSSPSFQKRNLKNVDLQQRKKLKGPAYNGPDHGGSIPMKIRSLVDVNKGKGADRSMRDILTNICVFNMSLGWKAFTRTMQFETEFQSGRYPPNVKNMPGMSFKALTNAGALCKMSGTSTYRQWNGYDPCNEAYSLALYLMLFSYANHHYVIQSTINVHPSKNLEELSLFDSLVSKAFGLHGDSCVRVSDCASYSQWFNTVMSHLNEYKSLPRAEKLGDLFEATLALNWSTWDAPAATGIVIDDAHTRFIVKYWHAAVHSFVLLASFMVDDDPCEQAVYKSWHAEQASDNSVASTVDHARSASAPWMGWDLIQDELGPRPWSPTQVRRLFDINAGRQEQGSALRDTFERISSFICGRRAEYPLYLMSTLSKLQDLNFKHSDDMKEADGRPPQNRPGKKFNAVRASFLKEKRYVEWVSGVTHSFNYVPEVFRAVVVSKKYTDLTFLEIREAAPWNARNWRHIYVFDLPNIMEIGIAERNASMTIIEHTAHRKRAKYVYT